MNTLLFIVNIVCYLMAMLGMAYFIKGKLVRNNFVVVSVIAWVAVVLHALMLSQAIVGDSGINIGASNAFSLTILATLMIILPNARRHPDISIVLFGFAITSLIVSESYNSQLALGSASPLLSLHIILSIVAYAVLMLVGIQAAIIVIRHKNLKKQTGYFYSHLPPLMNMEKWLFQLMLIGAVLLALSLITAIPFASDWFTRRFFHRSVLSIISLIIFTTLLFLHHFKGLRGKPAARFALMAFIVLLIGVSGSRVIQELFFNRT